MTVEEMILRMMTTQKQNILREKSFAFALEVIRFCKNKLYPNHEYILSKQLLKSATSIGANIEEALGAYSKKDFRAKLGIAYKEAKESMYWLKPLSASNYIFSEESEELQKLSDEIAPILYSIIKTTTPS